MGSSQNFAAYTRLKEGECVAKLVNYFSVGQGFERVRIGLA